MAVTREMRKRIDNLLAVYLNHLEQHQAGWHSENDLQRLADYKGDLPPPSGFDRSNAFMVGALGMTREQHAQLVKIQYLLGKPSPCGDCSHQEDEQVGMFATNLNNTMSAAGISEQERASWIRSNWPASSDEVGQPEYKTCRDWLAGNVLPSESELKQLSEALSVKSASLMGQVVKQSCASCSGLGVRLVKGILKNEYAMVLLAERYWAQESAKVVSGRLGLGQRQYELRLQRAREALAQEIETIDRIRQMIIQAEGIREVRA